ncbi:hypothetical protein SDC9_69094 [bioreactor metagenome]|uniref:Uncharacterized protein n=1 Tax=bioreactor metagenome TaxID=1076179 RepID=A0A644Y2A8_9ZZZZ
MAFNKGKYDAQFNKENYDQIKFYVYKGKRELIKKEASHLDVTLGKFITDALENQYGLDLSKPEESLDQTK